jgi:hypothetical protein
MIRTDTAIIDKTATSKRERRMLGLGLDSWNTLSLWFMGAAAVSAAALVVSQWAVIKLQREDTLAAQERIEELRNANLKLGAQIAPRRLSGEDSVEVRAVLEAASPLAIAIVSRLLDSDGNDFADDLAKAFTDSKWKVRRIRNWTQPEKGVAIATAEGTQLDAETEGILNAALDAAGIPHETTVIEKNAFATMSPNVEQRVLYLLVGAKP